MCLDELLVEALSNLLCARRCCHQQIPDSSQNDQICAVKYCCNWQKVFGHARGDMGNSDWIVRDR